MPLVSLVVPTLADEAAVERLLGQIRPDPRLEIVLADGGSGAPIRMDRHDVRVVQALRGRGTQMNAGAAVAIGAWVVFLHADSRLPPGWLEAFSAETGAAVGGWFRFALDDPAWQARVIEWGVRWRCRLLRLPYGDQGIFVRRTVFQTLGGYKELAFLEDVEFGRRLVAAGPVVELSIALATSSRRWRRDGWFRRSGRNLLLVCLYFAGVPTHRLARWY